MRPRRSFIRSLVAALVAAPIVCKLASFAGVHEHEPEVTEWWQEAPAYKFNPAWESATHKIVPIYEHDGSDTAHAYQLVGHKMELLTEEDRQDYCRYRVDRFISLEEGVWAKVDLYIEG